MPLLMAGRGGMDYKADSAVGQAPSLALSSACLVLGGRSCGQASPLAHAAVSEPSLLVYWRRRRRQRPWISDGGEFPSCSLPEDAWRASKLAPIFVMLPRFLMLLGSAAAASGALYGTSINLSSFYGGLLPLGPSSLYSSLRPFSDPMPTKTSDCLSARDLLASRPEFTILAKYYKDFAPALRSLLEGKGGKFTFFVPSDSAVNAFLALRPSNEPDIHGVAGHLVHEQFFTTVLSYAIVPDRVLSAADLADGEELHTALQRASSLRVKRQNGSVVILGAGSSAAVTKPNLMVCNGVLHAVDTILVPVRIDGAS